MQNKNKMRFDDYDYTPIQDLVIAQSEGNIVKFWTRRILLDFPLQELHDRNTYRLKTRVGFQDDRKNTIYASGFSKKEYVELREFQQTRKPIEVLGEVYKVEVKGGYINGIKMKKFQKAESPLCQMQASRKEIQMVRKLLSEVLGDPKGRKQWVLSDAIKEAVIEIIGIVGTDNDEFYNDCLDATICQAFSGGNLNNANGKIHTCLVGPPGCGKKPIWTAAKIINPICHEAQNIRVTVAGLTGEMKRGAHEGSISLAHRGVFGIQDFDKTDKKHELLAIFSDVMEDGKVSLRGAHKDDFDAETAIHIDLNRLSDLYLEKEYRKNVTQDVGLPLNIISRFDFIAEFDPQINLIQEKAEQIFLLPNKSKKIAKSKIVKFCERNRIESERFIKLTVAYVLNEIDEVDMSPVKKYMAERFVEITQANKNLIDKVMERSPLNLRLANSLEKHVCALTRIQFLEVSNRAAVDKALHLLSRKLDFLKNIDEEFIVPNFRTVGLLAFQRWIVETYGSKGFSPKEAIEKYGNDGSPCGERSGRTLRNWIKETAVRKRHGKWKIRSVFLDKYKGF